MPTPATGLALLLGMAVLPATDWREFDLPPVQRLPPVEGLAPSQPPTSRPGATRAEAFAVTSGVALGTAAFCRVHLTRLMRLEGLVLNAIQTVSLDEGDRRAAMVAYFVSRDLYHRSEQNPRADCRRIEVQTVELEQQMGLR